MFNIIFANDTDLNHGPLAAKASALPTEPQPDNQFVYRRG